MVLIQEGSLKEEYYVNYLRKEWYLITVSVIYLSIGFYAIFVSRNQTIIDVAPLVYVIVLALPLIFRRLGRWMKVRDPFNRP